MSKLNFYYGAMASGKSLECIRVIHNYRERGFNPLILKPAVDDRSTTIQSRAGAEVDCIPLKRDEQIFHKMLEHRETDEIVIIDEAQFLTKRQVQELRVLSILQDVIVICFGLKVDYRGYFFEGSKRLFELADDINLVKGLCRCGKIATNNVRLDMDNKPSFDGEQVQTGYHYEAMCHICFCNESNMYNKIK